MDDVMLLPKINTLVYTCANTFCVVIQRLMNRYMAFSYQQLFWSYVMMAIFWQHVSNISSIDGGGGHAWWLGGKCSEEN